MKIGDFKSGFDAGMWIEFAMFLKAGGYVVEVTQGYWQLTATDPESGREVWVRIADSIPARRDVTRLLQPADVTRVVLLDFDSSEVTSLDFWVTAAKSQGIGVYSRQLGWLQKPHSTLKTEYHKLVPLLNPLYSFDKRGRWVKACTKCGEFKLLDQFYRRPRAQATAKDPYRNQCKECFKGGA